MKTPSIETPTNSDSITEIRIGEGGGGYSSGEMRITGPRESTCKGTLVVESAHGHTLGHGINQDVTDARIMVLGAESVGKSAVTVRFLTKRYIGEYESNIDLLYRQTVVHNEVPVYMEVLDTCPKGEQLTERDSHLRWANAFVIVYSVCNRTTFREVETQIKHIQLAKSPCSVPIAIIGNKADLEHRREIMVDEGRDLAEEYGCFFFEVSAADGYTEVREAFLVLLKEVYEATKNKLQVKRRRSSVTRNVANKVMQAMFGSPRRSRKISLP
ncbi:ras-related and estrogen-regulated growth inhibitor-like [Asterias rubens]|uniref:ras-related and estrogen-regulated growth inhibitor-like n=1 Tax=Asterias rubens TaxID=7604 RepID=UPI001454EC2A|nr:ras-related and estrogen-regulated growth inhibitor-like [Asterias rubens]